MQLINTTGATNTTLWELYSLDPLPSRLHSPSAQWDAVGVDVEEESINAYWTVLPYQKSQYFPVYMQDSILLFPACCVELSSEKTSPPRIFIRQGVVSVSMWNVKTFSVASLSWLYQWYCPCTSLGPRLPLDHSLQLNWKTALDVWYW